jgi:beta-1,4-mannosyltransferase
MTARVLLDAPIQTVRVLSVPTDHVYVRHLSPTAEEGWSQDPQVVRLRDPQDPWWPPPALDPDWLEPRTGDFDILHLHFGFDARSVDDLRGVVDVLAAAGRPLVQTVHDLRNPHHVDRRTHDQHLDVLVPAADALITLTPGAAEEIRQRWDRVATVLPHPHVVPLAEMARRQSLRAHRSGFTVGLHLKSMRPCMSGPPVVAALMGAVAEIDGAILRIDVHRDVAEPNGARYDGALMEAIGAAQAGGALVDIHDFYSDDELWDYLGSIDVSVLPYRYGTHSGWLEACRDLGTAVVAPDCGYYADQGPVHSFHLDENGLDGPSLRDAVRAAFLAGRPEPAPPRFRAAQRRDIAAKHAKIYAGALR